MFVDVGWFDAISAVEYTFLRIAANIEPLPILRLYCNRRTAWAITISMFPLAPTVSKSRSTDYSICAKVLRF